jgi:hypothetical protein
LLGDPDAVGHFIKVLALQLRFLKLLNQWATMIRAWMAEASIETTLELWASSLRDVKARVRVLFD